MSRRQQITSHELFTHDSIDSLGYDWERVADPDMPPRFPLKVYLPQTTADVVAIVNEARTLKQRLRIRSKGHSSNDLVLAPGGAVLCTEKMNKILAFTPESGTVTVQAGAVLADVDAYLAKEGWGLTIIGDHNHITAGGFASVGGISPASHRHGLFIDTVRAIEYVRWDGQVATCSRATGEAEMHRVLGGTGQHGVLTALTIAIEKMDKTGTILRNDRLITRDLEDFLRASERQIAQPGDAQMERGVWVDYPIAGRRLRVGQFSTYSQPSTSAYHRFRDRLAYGYLHGLGRIAGRLGSRPLEMAVKLLGMIGIILSPRYASTKNIESFTDKVLDSTVGDPTRMLIVLAPMKHYQPLFRELYELCEDLRARTRCFTFISFYVKGIRSRYLSGGGPPADFCELMLYLGVVPEKIAPEMDALVKRIDEMAAARGAFRYMHTKTVSDPALRAKIDPNSRYVAGAGV